MIRRGHNGGIRNRQNRHCRGHRSLYSRHSSSSFSNSSWPWLSHISTNFAVRAEVVVVGY